MVTAAVEMTVTVMEEETPAMKAALTDSSSAHQEIEEAVMEEAEDLEGLAELMSMNSANCLRPRTLSFSPNTMVKRRLACGGRKYPTI